MNVDIPYYKLNTMGAVSLLSECHWSSVIELKRNQDLTMTTDFINGNREAHLKYKLSSQVLRQWHCCLQEHFCAFFPDLLTVIPASALSKAFSFPEVSPQCFPSKVKYVAGEEVICSKMNRSEQTDPACAHLQVADSSQ